jgi:hypothetical protein
MHSSHSLSPAKRHQAAARGDVFLRLLLLAGLSLSAYPSVDLLAQDDPGKRTDLSDKDAATANDAPAETPPIAIDETVFARVGERAIARAKIDSLLRQRQAANAPRTAAGGGNSAPALERAAAGVLVRQELAHQALESQGGAALQQLADRAIDRLAAMESARGSSLIKAAEQQGLTADMLRRDIAWQISWREYLRRFQTEDYRRQWFQKQPWRYDGSQAEFEQYFWPWTTDASREVRQSFLEAAKALQTGLLEGTRDWESPPAETAENAPQYQPLAWINAVGSVPPVVARAAFEGQLNVPLGPIISPAGVHLLRVKQRMPGHGDFARVEQPERLSREMADYLLEQLVRQRLREVAVEWDDEDLAPPVGHQLRRATDEPSEPLPTEPLLE